MKSLRDEICLRQMKSKQSLDEIKSTHPPSRRISSHVSGISSWKRFIPPKRVDLVEKDSGLYPILSLFLVEARGVSKYSSQARKTCGSCGKVCLSFFSRLLLPSDDLYEMHFATCRLRLLYAIAKWKRHGCAVPFSFGSNLWKGYKILWGCKNGWGGCIFAQGGSILTNGCRLIVYRR